MQNTEGEEVLVKTWTKFVFQMQMPHPKPLAEIPAFPLSTPAAVHLITFST